MIKTNLIDIISSFDAKEMKEFSDFVHSPYFNKNKKVITLFSYLKKLHPEFQPEKIKKEIVFKKLFPKEDFNDGFIRLIIHNLNKLAEDFVSTRKIDNNLYLKDRLLLEYFVIDKKLPKLFEKKYNSLKEKNSKIIIKDADYYINEFEVEVLFGKYKFLLDDNVLNVTDLPKEEYLKKTEHLKKHFFITSLNQYRYLLNTRTVINVNYEDDFRDVIVNYIDSHPEYLDVPVLKLHFLELCLLLRDDEKYFYELEEHLINNFHAFSWGEKFSTMSILENYCLAMIYKDKPKYYEEKHKLHQFIIKHKLFAKYEGGKISETEFHNITGIGFRLGKFDWVENFIHENKDNLEEKDKDNVLNMSFSKLYLAKRDFDNALEHLNKIQDIDDVYYKMMKKTITLEIYYEKGLIVEAFNLIDNFKHYVANDKITTAVEKERVTNFIRLTHDLLKIKSKQDYKSLYLVEKELKEKPNIFKKDWLMKKADELRK